MVHYKLSYFNVRGRAEIARFMFAEAGVPYEDHRFEFAQWPEEKASTLIEPIFISAYVPLHVKKRVLV